MRNSAPAPDHSRNISSKSRFTNPRLLQLPLRKRQLPDKLDPLAGRHRAGSLVDNGLFAGAVLRNGDLTNRHTEILPPIPSALGYGDVAAPRLTLTSSPESQRSRVGYGDVAAPRLRTQDSGPKTQDPGLRTQDSDSNSELHFRAGSSHFAGLAQPAVGG